MVPMVCASRARRWRCSLLQLFQAHFHGTQIKLYVKVPGSCVPGSDVAGARREASMVVVLVRGG